MNLRDVKPHTLKRISTESREEFAAWLKSTNGEMFRKNLAGMNELVPVDFQTIWDYAYSHGVRAILRRVDNLKENV